MKYILLTVMIVAMGLALLSVLIGMFVMAKGGETSKKYSNRFMQFRVTMQAIAIGAFVLMLISSS